MNRRKCTRISALCIAAVMLSSTFTACKTKVTNNKSASSGQASSSYSIPASSETASAASSSESASAVSLAGRATNSDVSSKYTSAKYETNKTVFNSAATRRETKISINNPNIRAPKVPSSAIDASPIPRTIVEGVDGAFIDAKITEHVKNLGGKTYTFGTFWTDAWDRSSRAKGDAKYCGNALKSVENDYNCKIILKNMALSTFEKSVNAAKATGVVYANIFDTETEMSALIKDGDYADLQKVKSIGFNTNQWNPVQSLIASYKGGVYGVGLRQDYIEREIMLFDKTIANKYNLGNLYDFANKGNWTDDLFLQVSQRYKKVSGGKTSVCTGLFPESLLNLVFSNWTSPFGITSQKYIFNGQDSTVLDILTFCQNYVKQGLYDKKYVKSDFATDGQFCGSLPDAQYSISQFNQGKTLFYLTTSTQLPSLVTSAKDGFGVLPLPKGPSAGGYTSVIANGRYLSLFNGDPDIENSGDLLVAIANRMNLKKADLSQYATTLVRDKDSLNMVLNSYGYKQILYKMSGGGIYLSAAVKCILNQETTPKQAMDSIASKMQTQINTDYGQK